MFLWVWHLVWIELNIRSKMEEILLSFSDRKWIPLSTMFFCVAKLKYIKSKLGFIQINTSHFKTVTTSKRFHRVLILVIAVLLFWQCSWGLVKFTQWHCLCNDVATPSTELPVCQSEPYLSRQLPNKPLLAAPSH